MLTFVIPVRHPQNADDWGGLKTRLGQTARSIARQDGAPWRAVVVANHGAELPDLPAGFETIRVGLAPNSLYRRGASDREAFHEAVRADKGRRVLAGMLRAGADGHFMVVDDDDFVSRRLASFVAANPRANGWRLSDGYVWTEGGRLLYLHPNFSRLCGSSHIVRADLLDWPPTAREASEAFVRRMLGSHVFIDDHLAASGTPLAPLPFIGAVYRTGHAEAHSQSGGVIERFFLQRSLLPRPLEMARRLSRLRFKTAAAEAEFFGA